MLLHPRPTRMSSWGGGGVCLAGAGGQTTHRMRAHVHGTDALPRPAVAVTLVSLRGGGADSPVVDRHATFVVVRVAQS